MLGRDVHSTHQRMMEDNAGHNIHDCQSKYAAMVAKLWQRDGIAAVETESRGKIQFFIANEGRPRPKLGSQIITMKLFLCELFCSRCVGHDCHVPSSGRSGSIGRPVSESVSSQCRVGAGCQDSS
jgi:hypothetical protein